MNVNKITQEKNLKTLFLTYYQSIFKFIETKIGQLKEEKMFKFYPTTTNN